MSSKKVHNKIKAIRDAILARKLEKMARTTRSNSTKKIKNKLNNLIQIKNSWNKPYHIKSIDSHNIKVPRILAKNNVRKIKRVTFKNFTLSNSPLKGSPLYDPLKYKASMSDSKKDSRKKIREILSRLEPTVPKYSKKKIKS